MSANNHPLKGAVGLKRKNTYCSYKLNVFEAEMAVRLIIDLFVWAGGVGPESGAVMQTFGGLLAPSGAGQTGRAGK